MGQSLYPGGDGYGHGFLASPTGAAPEPAGWALMILGFGGLGAALRRQRRTLADA